MPEQIDKWQTRKLPDAHRTNDTKKNATKSNVIPIELKLNAIYVVNINDVDVIYHTPDLTNNDRVVFNQLLYDWVYDVD